MRTAFAAALLLVVQSLFASAALGAAAQPVALDLWGNPLCLSGPDGEPVHGGDAKLPPCCTLSCPMAAVPLGPAPDAASILLPRGVELAASQLGTAPIDPPARRWRPGNPRAPPGPF
ncbi:MAG: hypothetical protein DI629_11070 [Mesorhizobium amorphae]|nr:MAG: hypothetical protein DI629_11070 [Mesorhizobium amorphae]